MSTRSPVDMPTIDQIPQMLTDFRERQESVRGKRVHAVAVLICEDHSGLLTADLADWSPDPDDPFAGEEHVDCVFRGPEELIAILSGATMTHRQRSERIIMDTLAENIRFRRKSLGWTQQDLADASGLSRVTIARLETTRLKSEWPTICAIADALGCSTDDLRESRKKVAV